VPRALRMARPDSHCVMAKHNSLLRYVNLGQHAPTGEEILLRSGDLVVIALDEMDRLAGQALPIGDHLLRSPQAEVPKEIENVVWPYAGVHAVDNCNVHRQYIRKRAIAIPNDIEVPEMEVRREPDATHDSSFSLISPRCAGRATENHVRVCV